MPFPPPPRARGPRRRTLLAAAAGAVLLVGCSSGDGEAGDGETEESTGGSPSVTERARARAARDSSGLVERYDAVLAAHPTLAERLTPLRAEVVRHAEAFGGLRQAAPSTPAPTMSAAPSDAVPVSEADVLAELATAERALADRRMVQLLDVPGELARLLASVAAAGAAHAYLLTEGGR